MAHIGYGAMQLGYGSITRDEATGLLRDALAADLGATPSQVALAWLLAHDDRTLLIPGTANPAHLAEDLAAGEIHLPADAMAALDQLRAPQ